MLGSCTALAYTARALRQKLHTLQFSHQPSDRRRRPAPTPTPFRRSALLPSTSRASSVIMKGVGGLAPPPVEEEEAAASASHHHVIFIIERACLETAKVGASHRLLNCDDHQNYISRKGRDPAHYRPDICHQSLLAVLDSPLNKAGKVKAVFVRTEKNVLIRVSPTTRVPRTFKRFSGLICQLLYKLSIRATNGPDKLMRLVKGPVTRHLPANCQVIGLSRTAPAAQRASQLVGALEDERPVAFVVGGFSHGQIEIQYADREVSISEYPLSAACCIAKLTSALEEKWGIA